MAGRFSITAAFGATTGNLPRVFGQIESGAARMSRRFSTAFSGLQGGLAKAATVSDRFTAKLADVGKSAALIGGAGIVAATAKVVSSGADFEAAISSLGAVSLASRDQIADLEKEALRLGSVTKFTATEAAQGMELMARAGFSNAETLKGIPGLLDAAAAEGGELAETVGIVSNTLKGFGLAASDTQRVADVLTLASARTNSSITSLGESLKNAAPIARQFNIPMEDATAAVALLQDVGIDASEAGTATSTMLTMLAAPTKEASKQMASLGIKIADTHGNMLPLPKIFEQFAEASKKAGGNAKAAAVFSDLLGMRGQRAGINLTNAFTSGAFGKLVTELEHAEGSAKRMAALRMDNVKGDWELLTGSIDGVSQSIWRLQSGAIRGLLKSADAFIQKNQEGFIKGLDGFIKDATAAAREAIPIIKEFGGGLVQGARDVLPVFRAIGGAVTTVASYIGGLFGDDKASSARNFGRAIAWVGTAIVGVSAATRVATGVQVAYRAALVGVKGATWLLKGAYSAVTNSLGSFTRASRTSTAAVTKGMGGIGAATSKMAKFQEAAGAATLALGAWALAWEANENLKSETQGLGIGDIAKGMVEQGTWNPFDVVDRHQNAIAKAEAKRREQEKQAADVGGLTALNSTIEHAQRKVADLSAAATTSAVKTPEFAAAFVNVRSELEHAALSIPKMSLDPKLATGAEAAAEKLDRLTASMAQLEAVLPSGMRGGDLGATPAPTGGGSGARAGTAATAPALAPQLVVPREQTAEQATVIAAAVERAIKRGMEQSAVNVNVNGSTAAESYGGKGKARSMPRVTNTGDL